MLMQDRAEVSEKLADFQQALFNDVRETFDAIQTNDDSVPMRPQDLPDALRSRFIGVHGKLLLQVYPKKVVSERYDQEEFIKDLRTIHPEVTGTSVQLYAYTTLR